MAESTHSLLSLVIPMYNESDRFHLLEQALDDFAAKWKTPAEVILVNDGSKDETLQLLNQHYKGKDTELIKYVIVDVQPNQGKGNALREGVAGAKGDHILTLDADMAAHPLELNKWLQLLPQQRFPDDSILIGSREHPQSEIDGSVKRRFFGNIFNFLIQFLTGLSLRDTQCGFKLYPKSVAKFLFAQMRIKGWAHDVELLHIADLHQIPIKDMPLKWEDVENSKISVLADGIKMALTAFQIILMVRLHYFIDRPLLALTKPASVTKFRKDPLIFRLLFAISAILSFILLVGFWNSTAEQLLLIDYMNQLPDNNYNIFTFLLILCSFIPTTGFYFILKGITGFMLVFYVGLILRELLGRWSAAFIGLLMGLLLLLFLPGSSILMLYPFLGFLAFFSYQLIRLMGQQPLPGLLVQILLALAGFLLAALRPESSLLLLPLWLFGGWSYFKSIQLHKNQQRFSLVQVLLFFVFQTLMMGLGLWLFNTTDSFLALSAILPNLQEHWAIPSAMILVTILFLVRMFSFKKHPSS